MQFELIIRIALLEPSITDPLSGQKNALVAETQTAYMIHWNSLPTRIRHPASDSLTSTPALSRDTFHKQLKTHLFSHSYHNDRPTYLSVLHGLDLYIATRTFYFEHDFTDCRQCGQAVDGSPGADK